MRNPKGPDDNAIYAILGANLLTLLMAVWQDWGLLQLMWPFWMQSLVIGWYARQRILSLRQFSTDGLRINDRPVEPTPETQRKVANFFALHYGFFHVIYGVFLTVFTAMGAADGFVPVTNESTGVVTMLEVGRVHPFDVLIYLALGYAFWRTHQASHREHVEADLARSPKLGTLMMIPYARVLPMHMTLVFAAPLGAGAAIWLFALLKTAADVVMHRVEHRMLQTSRSA